jgi:hypothetical protein
VVGGVLRSRPMGHSDDSTEMLSALGWDLRGLGEAQLRSLTSLQRCIDDFRRTGNLEAAREILRHIAELEARSPVIRETLRRLRDELVAVEPGAR